MINQDKKIEYIWYCPRRSCGAIVIKTPYLELKARFIHTCKRCGEKYTGNQLMIANKHNVRKFVVNLEKVGCG